MTLCRVPWCLAFAATDPDPRIRSIDTTGICEGHRTLSDESLLAALHYRIGLVAQVERVKTDRIERSPR